MQLYDLRKLYTAWAQFDFLPHKILAVLTVLSVVVPRPRRSKAESAANDAGVEAALLPPHRRQAGKLE